MKPFDSFMANEIEQYIAYRSGMGYKRSSLASHLQVLDRFIASKAAGWDALRPALLLEFRSSLNGAPGTVNAILASVKGFCHYLVRCDVLLENPMQDVPHIPMRAFMPFIFSEDETTRLLRLMGQRVRKDHPRFLKDLSVYTVMILLCRCGLRLTEPLNLTRESYCPDDQTIYIKNTKFGKDRRIPIPFSVVPEMENYLSVRNRFDDRRQNPYLFPGEAHHPLGRSIVYRQFHQTLKAMGLNHPGKSLPQIRFGSPNLHSFRHSFAVNTLKRIKTQGKSPQDALPILSAYMGHKKYSYTAIYLKALDANQRNGLFDITIYRMK